MRTITSNNGKSVWYQKQNIKPTIERGNLKNKGKEEKGRDTGTCRHLKYLNSFSFLLEIRLDDSVLCKNHAKTGKKLNALLPH